ncbi:tRNA nucleotidyltransferase [hydrothermal vent metagenome]|uniref:tRNA nucleotidyltransferase n=1 Tax=hydrothermal vent metagenome TaxID=652676 RepID=A0A1W1BPS5_9ZZZZ
MLSQLLIIPQILNIISDKLATNYNAKLIIVGGAVRDHFLNNSIKDYDIEVYGLDEIKDLENILKEYGTVNIVGKSFGVLKFNFENEEYDFSFPRLENKVSKGHRGFDVICDGNLDFKEASRRRDFTINAMGYSISTKEFLDPFNGRDDIKNKLLRVVDAKSFIEDPLRVYRAIQFSARFEYRLSNESEILCKQMVQDNMLDELPKERVYQELVKMLLKSKRPSIGFHLMNRLNIKNNFNLKYIDRASTSNIKILLATLCIGLDEEESKKLLYTLIDNHNLILSILKLLRFYNKPHHLYTDLDIKNLATKIDISELVTLIKVDKNNYEIGERLLSKAKKLNVENGSIKPLINGKELIDIGLTPSPQFKHILDKLYQTQLEKDITSKDEAIKYLKLYTSSNTTTG